MKKIFNFVLLNIFFLFIILLLEAGIRIIFPNIKSQSIDRNIIIDNKYYNSPGLKPNTHGTVNDVMFYIDKYGFSKFFSSVNESKKAWLFLGDSVTMGIGVENDSTFAGRVHNLSKMHNVLNPSTIGYNLRDYVNIVQYFVVEKKLNFNIHHVTLFWCLNDVYSDISSFDTPGGNVRLIFGDLLRYVRFKSRIYLLLKNIFFDRAKSYYFFDAAFYDKNNNNFQSSIQNIKRINKLCKDRNIYFEIVLLPYEYQLRFKSEDNLKPQSLMKRELIADNVCVLDPIDYLISQKQKSKKFYLFGDGIHFSDFGHKIISEYILNYFN